MTDEPPPFILDIFIHVDAVDRASWQGEADDRPLTELGQRQAGAIAELLVARGPVDALLSSPALRCRQSLQPLAKRLGLPVEIVPGFRDTLGFRAPQGWENPSRPGPDPLGGAYSAGSAYAAFLGLAARGLRRAVLCSYGDVVPAFLAFLAGLDNVPAPQRSNDKGFVYSVELKAGKISLESRAAPADFPS